MTTISPRPHPCNALRTSSGLLYKNVTLVDQSLEQIRRVCRPHLHLEEELNKLDIEIFMVVSSLECTTGGYKIDRTAAFRRIVSEVCSLARPTAAAKLLPSVQSIPCMALDITVDDDEGML